MKPWDAWSPEFRAMAADYERRDRVHKAELAGRRTRDETRHKPGVDYAVDVIRLPLHQSHNSSQRIRQPMPNNDANIAANCGVTPEAVRADERTHGLAGYSWWPRTSMKTQPPQL